jgi:tetratricopeptide (TPR) repeat protein
MSRIATGNSASSQSLGSYQLISQIGHGRLGVVYQAAREQQEFAIRVIPRELIPDPVRQRLRYERQILASLEHPHIAAWCDGGTTADGSPYFVTAYVAGQQLIDYCAAHNLLLNDRLKIFLQVCAATAYAHRNLIVHGDLKPANILVAADGSPKLLDFGLVRLLSPHTGFPQSENVQLSRLLITPRYASPEQLRDEPATTASDIYSLGVILQELLAGSGGLEGVVRKATEKNPERRFAAVEQLAAEIEHYLTGSRLGAENDSFLSTLRQFLRRQRLAIESAGMILIAAAVLFLVWRGHSPATPDAEIVSQRQKTDGDKLAALIAALSALSGNAAGREEEVLETLAQLSRLSGQASDDQALQRALAVAYQKVGDVQQSSLGDLNGAKESYQKSFEMLQGLARQAPDDADLLRNLSLAHEGLGQAQSDDELPVALDHHRQALRIRQSLLAADPANSDYQRLTAAAHYNIGATSLRAAEQPDQMRASLAALQTAARMQEKLIAGHAASAQDRLALMASQQQIGRALLQLGAATKNNVNNEQALAALRKGLTIGQQLLDSAPDNQAARRSVAALESLIGVALERAGELSKAMSSFQSARKTLEEMSASSPAADPIAAAARRELAEVLSRIGELQKKDGDTPGATDSYRRSLALIESLIEAGESRAEDYRHAAERAGQIAQLLEQTGDLNEAITTEQKAFAWREKLRADHPADPSQRIRVAESAYHLGEMYAKLAASAQQPQQWRAAREWYQRSLDGWLELKKSHALDQRTEAMPEKVAGEIAKCDAALSN